MNIKPFAVVTLLLMSAVVEANDSVRVLGVRAPAWVEQNGAKQPITTGQSIAKGDVVVTDQDGRVIIALGDDSRLRVGSESRLVFEQLRSSGAGEGGLKALLNVKQGALHFSNQPAATSRSRHIRARFNGITVDAREGNVVFSGETEKQLDISCLLSGEIEVFRNGAKNGEKLNGQNTCYVLPAGDGEERILKQITAEQAELVTAITALDGFVEPVPALAQAPVTAVQGPRVVTSVPSTSTANVSAPTVSSPRIASPTVTTNTRGTATVRSGTATVSSGTASASSSSPRVIRAPRVPTSVSPPSQARIAAPPVRSVPAARPAPRTTTPRATTPRTTNRSATRYTPPATRSSSNGRWWVHVASYSKLNQANEKAAELRRAGYSVVVNEVTVRGRTWQRVSINGIATRGEANRLLGVMRSQYSASSPWADKK